MTLKVTDNQYALRSAILATAGLRVHCSHHRPNHHKTWLSGYSPVFHSTQRCSISFSLPEPNSL